MKSFLLVGIWGVLVACGFCLTMKWSLTPGAKASIDQEYEGRDTVSRIEGIFHPQCPCSSASIELLKQALEVHKGRLKTTIYFVGDHREGKNVDAARRIEGATIEFLSESQGLQRYGDATSGQIFVWHRGALQYSGGVTDARGESARGAAYREFLSALNEGGEPVTLPVYGCSIRSAP